MIRKKRLFISFILLIITFFSIFFLLQTIRRTNQKKAEYQSVPSFSLLDLGGSMRTEKDLKRNTTTLFLFFDPECDLCHSELKEINAHSDALIQCQMIFFSTQPAGLINDFLENIAFKKTPNMFFLTDEKAELSQTMEIQGPPTAIIYDKSGKLIKRFSGPVKIETLIKYLSE
jgi:thioredoxin-related protein